MGCKSSKSSVPQEPTNFIPDNPATISRHDNPGGRLPSDAIPTIETPPHEVAKREIAKGDSEQPGLLGRLKKTIVGGDPSDSDEDRSEGTGHELVVGTRGGLKRRSLVHEATEWKDAVKEKLTHAHDDRTRMLAEGIEESPKYNNLKTSSGRSPVPVQEMSPPRVTPNKASPAASPSRSPGKKGKGTGLEDSMNVLRVEVMQGRDLAAKDPNGFSDPYCVVMVGSRRQKTQIIEKTLNPNWLSSFEFYDVVGTDVLKVQMWDKDSLTMDDFMGIVELPISDIKPEKYYDRWFQLKQRTSKDRVNGTLRLRLLLLDLTTMREKGISTTSAEYYAWHKFNLVQAWRRNICVQSMELAGMDMDSLITEFEKLKMDEKKTDAETEHRIKVFREAGKDDNDNDELTSPDHRLFMDRFGREHSVKLSEFIVFAVLERTPDFVIKHRRFFYDLCDTNGDGNVYYDDLLTFLSFGGLADIWSTVFLLDQLCLRRGMLVNRSKFDGFISHLHYFLKPHAVFEYAISHILREPLDPGEILLKKTSMAADYTRNNMPTHGILYLSNRRVMFHHAVVNTIAWIPFTDSKGPYISEVLKVKIGFLDIGMIVRCRNGKEVKFRFDTQKRAVWVDIIQELIQAHRVAHEVILSNKAKTLPTILRFDKHKNVIDTSKSALGIAVHLSTMNIVRSKAAARAAGEGKQDMKALMFSRHHEIMTKAWDGYRDQSISGRMRMFVKNNFDSPAEEKVKMEKLNVVAFIHNFDVLQSILVPFENWLCGFRDVLNWENPLVSLVTLFVSIAFAYFEMYLWVLPLVFVGNFLLMGAVWLYAFVLDRKQINLFNEFHYQGTHLSLLMKDMEPPAVILKRVQFVVETMVRHILYFYQLYTFADPQKTVTFAKASIIIGTAMLFIPTRYIMMGICAHIFGVQYIFRRFPLFNERFNMVYVFFTSIEVPKLNVK